MLTEATWAHFAEIGRKGGLKSRRTLSPAQARQMVALRMARKALQRFRTLCFWSARPDVKVTFENLDWLVEQLRRNGNMAAWKAAAQIDSLRKRP
jgi:hypothetical protein